MRYKGQSRLSLFHHLHLGFYSIFLSLLCINTSPIYTLKFAEYFFENMGRFGCTLLASHKLYLG